MSLGTGVFLSACLLSVVILYAVTHDRWNWSRLVLGLIAALAAIIGLGALGLWWADARSVREEAARVEEDRERYAVRIGDPFELVLQRQGSPDTLFHRGSDRLVAAYWDGYGSVAGTEKVFFFDTDSLLVEIRFLGDRFTSIEFGWVPEDRLELGASTEDVLELGAACREDVDSRRTLLEFPTGEPNVLRWFSLGHGDRRTIAHGWIRGQCPDV